MRCPHASLAAVRSRGNRARAGGQAGAWRPRSVAPAGALWAVPPRLSASRRKRPSSSSSPLLSLLPPRPDLYTTARQYLAFQHHGSDTWQLRFEDAMGDYEAAWRPVLQRCYPQVGGWVGGLVGRGGKRPVLLGCSRAARVPLPGPQLLASACTAAALPALLSSHVTLLPSPAVLPQLVSLHFTGEPPSLQAQLLPLPLAELSATGEGMGGGGGRQMAAGMACRHGSRHAGSKQAHGSRAMRLPAGC